MDNFELDGRLWKAQMQVPSLGNVKVLVYIMQEGDSSPSARQLEALTLFKALPSRTLEEIASRAVTYCQKVDSVVDLSAEGIGIDYDDIARHYRFTSLLIPQLNCCESNFVFVSADCDWEPEHGMQLLLEDGCVLWCGDHSTLPFSAQWKRIIDAPAEERRQRLEETLSRLG
jgi:hypothetical protein